MKYLLSIIILFSLTSVVHAGVTQRSPNNLGLVGYWSFDEGTSTKAGDFSGNKNSGLLFPGLSGTNTSTSTMWASGKHGKAINFDGVDDYVYLNRTTSLKPDYVTVSAWGKQNTSSGTQYFMGGNDSVFGYEMRITSGRVFYTVGNGTTETTASTSASVFSDLGWHNVVGTYDGTTISLYVDNVLYDSNTQMSGVTAYQSSNMTIGVENQISNGGWFNGKIDDVRIYNRALSAAEVLTLYKSGSAIQKQANNLGLVGYWSFDEGTSTLASDFSGNKVSGTLTNSPTWVSGKHGKALQFVSANSQRIDFSNCSLSKNLDGAAKITESFWFKPTAYPASTGGILSVSAGTAGTGVSGGDGVAVFFASSGKLQTSTRSQGGDTISAVSSNVVLPLNQWSFATVVYDFANKTNDWYINGVFDRSGSVPNYTSSTFVACTQNGSPNRIGASNTPDRYLDGVLDDVRFYNRALSATEIRALYKTGSVAVNISPTTRLTNGLVAYWTFDGNTVGRMIRDLITGNYNVSVIKASVTSPVSTSTSFGIGKIGQGAVFNATSSLQSVARSSAIDTGLNLSNNLSFGAWVKLKNNRPTTHTFITRNNTYYQLNVGGTGLPYARFVPSDYPTNPVWNVTATTAVDDNRWHHIFVTESNGVGNIYVDGVYEGTASSPAPLIGNGTGNWIALGGYIYGACPPSCQMTVGTIDEVRIYNRVLSASEVKLLYNMGK